MKSNPIKNNPSYGYTIIEMVMVIILVALLAAFSMQAIIMATGTYTTATRNYLELYQEGKLAMEKMVREIRDTDPSGITITTGSVTFTKQTDHDTPRDNSLAIQFQQSGNTIERQSGAGTFTLVDNIETSSFAANQDIKGVVTLSFIISRGDTQIPLRTAVYPRQP
ncbi:MAG: prepilin-type N-terminal cleavage/methylation domain-containing protein [Candidatus Auribacterota bacterium]|nr:prepilin-type N-terminal cleavage/methylation domain-containing protein [Candidatus Auribacterota bacterium]